MATNLGSINLLTAQIQPQGRWDRIYGWTVNTAKYIIILTELVVLCAIGYRFYLDGQIADLDRQIEEQKTILSNRTEEDSSVRFVSQVLSSIAKMEKTDYTLTAYYQKIIQLIPSSVDIQNISVDINAVSLNGTVPSYQALKTFEENISNSDFIEHGSASFTSNQQGDDSSIIFTATFKIKFLTDGG